jgi:phosphoribosylanthranilate isomerase
MPRTRIKICGIRTEDALLAAAEGGADAVGFMFVQASPRAITPEEAFDLMTLLPPFMASVGVFMDPSVDEFSDLEEICPTAYTQLHGSENERLVRSCGPDVIKAIKFDPATIRDELLRWEVVEEVGAILIDGTTAGSGVAFAWDQLVPHLADIDKPIILAGGLNPENVGEAIRILRPFGVDVSSGVERERGVKDPGLIHAFCEAVRRADAK